MSRRRAVQTRLARAALLGGATLVAVALPPGLIFAPTALAQPVVQALPVAGTMPLNAALARLARNPRDVEALIAAGDAALAMGDTDAAIGFFGRADALTPNSPRVQAGLASARVMAEDPLAALPLFEAADAGSPLEPARVADRGLAYDLLGDNITAQRYYRQAIAMGAGDEARRRLALNLAIMGDRRDVEVVLAPLLQKQDRAAWRSRAFALAILGDEDEAESVTKATMPADLAAGIAPYLRFMRRLTPAQQAAAANLGHFPEPAAVGVDDPRIAAYAAAHGLRRLASNDPALVPAGAPLGAKPVGAASAKPAGRHHRGGQGEAGAAVPSVVETANPPPEATASREVRAAEPGRLANVAPATTAPPPVVRAVSPPVIVPSRQMAAPAQTPVPPPGFDLARVEGSTARAAPAAVPQQAPPTIVQTPAPQPVVAAPLASVPTPAAPPAAAKSRLASFSEAFSAMAGDTDSSAAPAAGAVDIRHITPAKPVPRAPPPPVHPSRIWVQVGVGRDTDRLGSDWHRMTRDDPKLFRGKAPFVSAWGRTNRMLIGPFESGEAADTYLARFKTDHPSAFVWTSPAGQVVDPLGGT